MLDNLYFISGSAISWTAQIQERTTAEYMEYFLKDLPHAFIITNMLSSTMCNADCLVKDTWLAGKDMIIFLSLSVAVVKCTNVQISLGTGSDARVIH